VVRVATSFWTYSFCGKEWVLEEFKRGWALAGILAQNFAYQVFEWLGEGFRDLELLLARIDLNLELTLPIERQLTIVD